jgi:hypothetical protein
MIEKTFKYTTISPFLSDETDLVNIPNNNFPECRAHPNSP